MAPSNWGQTEGITAFPIPYTRYPTPYTLDSHPLQAKKHFKGQRPHSA